MTEPKVQSLISASEAARRLGVSVHRLYDLARQQPVPAVRLGRSLRFDPAQLDHYIFHGGTTWPGGWRKNVSSPRLSSKP